MKTLLFLSFLTFVAGLARFMQEYGIVESYSRYGLYCERSRRKGEANWWSVCTIASAILLIPVCLEIGEGSLLQCICFITPLTLLVIGFTPDFEKDHTTYVVHHVAGYLCGALTVVLAVFVFRNWLALVLAIVTMVTIGLVTRSIRKCYCLWLELSMYMYVYITLLMA